MNSHGIAVPLVTVAGTLEAKGSCAVPMSTSTHQEVNAIVARRIGLKRELSRLDLTMAGVGGVIGSGWLLGALQSANDAGPASIISWVIGGLFMLVLAIPFIELSSLAPSSGALARWPQLTHGTMTSFVMGWGLFLSYVVAPPIEAEASVQYANQYVHGLFNTATGLLTGRGLIVASLLVLLFFFVNYLGVRVFARVNTAVTLLKIAVPIVTFGALIIAGFHGSNISDSAHGGFMPFGTSGVLSAISLGGIAFSYEGFRQSIDLSGEGKNPKRDVPLALVYTLLGTMAIYTLLQVAFLGALRSTDLVHGWAGLSFTSPFAQLAAALNLGWLSIILYGDAIWSPGGSGFVYMASSSRVLWALPQNGYGPKELTNVHPKYGVPYVALIVSLIISLAALLPFPAWSRLVGIATSFGVLTYMMGGVSVTVLRRTAPTLPRIRIPGMNILGPLSFVFAALIVYWTSWPDVLYVALSVGVGFLLYLAYRIRNHYAGKDITSGIWLFAMILFVTVMSYVGSFGGRDWIRYPWDMVVVILGAIGFYFWAVRSGFETPDVRSFIETRELPDRTPGYEVEVGPEGSGAGG